MRSGITTPIDGNEVPGDVPDRAGHGVRAKRGKSKKAGASVTARKCRKGIQSAARRAKKIRKPAGRNISCGVSEAARILKEWGYIVGRIDDPDRPFDLIARRGRENLSIRIVRPREPVRNASDVRYYYSREVLEMQPYWESDADNIQFWLFSRVAGLLRYRVFRGGIWNIETMQEGWQEKRKEKADCTTGVTGLAVQKSRTAPLPIHATGLD
ncbi:hypothetical protein [Methanoregula sp.]|uniref:hypothetical protein n=1 Tax=Methanoregula sp. TaxID=2052170 RepID=UPI0026352A29|nr:hypothetical protein [Methanoregula sp.]MDD5144370.1 hypothetical protein [Methanoregula sp.]